MPTIEIIIVSKITKQTLLSLMYNTETLKFALLRNIKINL